MKRLHNIAEARRDLETNPHAQSCISTFLYPYFLLHVGDWVLSFLSSHRSTDDIFIHDYALLNQLHLEDQSSPFPIAHSLRLTNYTFIYSHRILYTYISFILEIGRYLVRGLAEIYRLPLYGILTFCMLPLTLSWRLTITFSYSLQRSTSTSSSCQRILNYHQPRFRDRLAPCPKAPRDLQLHLHPVIHSCILLLFHFYILLLLSFYILSLL